MTYRLSENSDEKTENEENLALPSWLWMLFFAGFALLVAGIAVVAVASFMGDGSASGGVVVFIGPFPIVFGAGPDAAWLVLIGVIISAISIILFIVARRKVFGKAEE